MRKITLQLESLHVDSFVTTALISGEGTVIALEDCEHGAFSEIKPSEGGNCKTLIGDSCKCHQVPG